jgi:hypothetical protein
MALAPPWPRAAPLVDALVAPTDAVYQLDPRRVEQLLAAPPAPVPFAA